MNSKVSVGDAVQADHEVIIIGSGFSGVNAAIRLKEEGIENFVVLERAYDVGGTWRDNTYPGCACDVPSHLYSYSFEQNPNWSRAYSGYSEIQHYIRHCAEKYGVMPHLRFGVEVTGAQYDEVTGIWTIKKETGESLTAKSVISAVGGLVNPRWPNFKGMDSFKGDIFHTARWNHDVDLAGKRVAVVGTGASAIQVVPSIQEKVGSLTLFQRSAPWILPKPNAAVSDKTKKLFKRFPLAQRMVRNSILFLSEAIFAPLVILDTPLQNVLQKIASGLIKRQVKDPVLRAKVTPDFHIGCKRVLFASDYYPALCQPHVDVVTDGISGFTETGIITADGRELEFDVVVLATGFSVDIANAPFDIVGEGDEPLSTIWGRAGGKAYKGITVPQLPNWYLMLGPNTGPGHTSVLIYTEAQADYIVQAIKTKRENNLKQLSVKADVLSRYHTRVQGRMKYTSWTSGCQSWYLDEHGENHTLFPGLASEYALSVRHFKLSEYDVKPA